MNTNPDTQKVREFVNAFEEVFDRDWAYTKVMLGISDETEEQRRSALEAGIESISIIADDGSFISPKVEDEIEDWGNRGRLLSAFRAIRDELRG